MMVIYANDYEQEDLVDSIYGIYKTDPNSRTLVISASWRQSKQLYELLSKKYPDVELESATESYYKVANSNLIFHVLGDGSKIRGLRAKNLIVNTYYNIPKDILDIIVRGFLATSDNPIQAVKAAAIRKKESEDKNAN